MEQVKKTGDFETDAKSGYYNSRHEEFMPDFEAWLKYMGVPERYVQNAAHYLWQEGHAYGYYEVLNVSYDFIDIFK